MDVPFRFISLVDSRNLQYLPRKSGLNQGTAPYLNGTEQPKKNITTAKIWRLKATRAR
jgi:hypothetical protein